MQQTIRIPVSSATLPATQQFEQNLLSRDPNQIAQTAAQYSAVYGTVPNSAAASPQTRDMIDMTDAAAQAAMKRAIEIDALADLELHAADQINESIQAAAPGSAPIIEAQADAWLVRANAYTQSATADLMRVRAIDLANASANVKNGAANAASVQQQILNLLKRPWIVFYFQQLLQTALNGIDGANVTSAVLGVAGLILLLSFLYSAYQAFSSGGDVRLLAFSGVKYLILWLLFSN
jgi:hypothetical protein